MNYVVRNEHEKCGRCAKDIFGSVFHVRDDIYSCTDCAREYEKKLMPQIGKMVIDFFQVARSSTS